MRCPFCEHTELRVIDSRAVQDGNSIRRRRECERCGRRFTTFERIEENLPMVVKKDGRREPFNREKLLNGLRLACRKRPVSTSQLESFVDSLERSLIAAGQREISSRSIGEKVMAGLRHIDQVAYIRFGSVYHAVEDVEAFGRLVTLLNHDGTGSDLQSSSDDQPKSDEGSS
ncbi:MAG: transcriptional repressor NrdR [Bradymonadales bacterium]|nr:transcriptional repressor NrdR [Bradymonadales bacterium]